MESTSKGQHSGGGTTMSGAADVDVWGRPDSYTQYYIQVSCTVTDFLPGSGYNTAYLCQVQCMYQLQAQVSYDCLGCIIPHTLQTLLRGLTNDNEALHLIHTLYTSCRSQERDISVCPANQPAQLRTALCKSGPYLPLLCKRILGGDR